MHDSGAVGVSNVVANNNLPGIANVKLAGIGVVIKQALITQAGQ